ncbi:MAG: hypothetical protein AAF587_14165 [Bacteroidota bacterium]
MKTSIEFPQGKKFPTDMPLSYSVYRSCSSTSVHIGEFPHAYSLQFVDGDLHLIIDLSVLPPFPASLGAELNFELHPLLLLDREISLDLNSSWCFDPLATTYSISKDVAAQHLSVSVMRQDCLAQSGEGEYLRLIFKGIPPGSIFEDPIHEFGGIIIMIDDF